MNHITLTSDESVQTPIPAARIARAISWIGHPLVVVTATVAIIISLRLANRVGLLVLLALLVSVVLPNALLLFRGVRSGQWSDADVSVRTERMRFYPKAIFLSACGLATLFFLHAPAFIGRGALVTLILLVIAALVNLKIKLSVHALFAFYCAVILFQVHWWAGTIALLLASLVFWSRCYLKRHTMLEMLVGTGLGLVGGVAAGWLP